MTSSWALQRFEGLTGRLSRRIPRAVGAALERARAGRDDPAPTDVEVDNHRRALRHVVTFAGNSNQNLLDVRWGETLHADDPR